VAFRCDHPGVYRLWFLADALFSMKSLDVHSTIGLAGIIATGALSNYNLFMASLAGTFTAGYMGVRFFRELRKYRRDRADYESQPPPKK
jgi:hypothetical protein